MFYLLLLAFVLLPFTGNISGTYGAVEYVPVVHQLKFILLTDLHVSPGTASDSALNRIVDEINTIKADFVVVTGDLTNSGSDAELQAVKNALDRITHPLYVIPGNHETNWAESAGLKFNELWGADRFIARYNGYMLAGFNTGPFMKMGDGIVKQEDLHWLGRELKKKNQNETIIAFSHYPVSEGLSNWPDVLSILKSAGCRLVFCGHGHSMRLYNFDGIAGIMCRSVILGRSPVPGYNIVQILNDTVLVYNKQLGTDPVAPDIKLNYLSPDTLSTLDISPLTDYSVNKKYSEYKIISTFTDSCSIFTGPCLAGNLIIYGNSAGILKALDRNSGAIAWQQNIAAPLYSTPVSSKGVVMAGSVDGYITGFNVSNGKKLWTVRTIRPVLAEGITDDEFLYIGGGDKEFYKIDFRNGKIIWKFEGTAGLIQGRPVLSESSVFFGAWDRQFYCLDRNTGTLNWKWNNGKAQVLYSPGNIYPVFSGNKVFIVAPDRYLTALDATTGEQIWRTGRHAVRESMGSSPDGSLIYAKLMNDTLIAVSATKDTPVTEWKIDADFGYEHNPCPVTATAKVILTGTRDGVIIAMDPLKHNVLWKYKAGNSSVNRIVIDNDNTIWCTLIEGKIIGIKNTFNSQQ